MFHNTFPCEWHFHCFQFLCNLACLLELVFEGFWPNMGNGDHKFGSWNGASPWRQRSWTECFSDKPWFSSQCMCKAEEFTPHPADLVRIWICWSFTQRADFLEVGSNSVMDSRLTDWIFSWLHEYFSFCDLCYIYSCRMYQALLSSGGRKAAKKLLKNISKEDEHVRYIIDACRMTYYSEDFKPSATVRSRSKNKASSKQRATSEGTEG